MKHIHVLPTDKPSRLFKSFGKLNIGDYITKRENLQVTNQHIYITSDEEIKEGDWIKWGEAIYKANKTYIPPFKKIILTTDQDLIKDGVQAIDDEFLEWFVKNPSCEYVEVNYIKTPSQIFDWYCKEMNYLKINYTIGNIDENDYLKKQVQIYQQAKQIMDAHEEGFYSPPFRFSRRKEAEQYYNETFKSE
jgi:hypothetical protein